MNSKSDWLQMNHTVKITNLHLQVFNEQTGAEPSWKGGKMKGKPGSFQLNIVNDNQYLFIGL